MVAFKYLAVLGLTAYACAQGQYGAPENSADVLTALEAVDDSTVGSGVAAAAYTPLNPPATAALTYENILLRSNWQDVSFVAQSAVGFYTLEGAQAIIDFVNNKLYPDQAAADQVYVRKRDLFVAGGFIGFINPGLLRLRAVVDAASAAVQAKTPAALLTNMTVAFTLLEQDYATTQEIQQFGSATIRN